MLSVIMLSVILLSIVMLSVFMLHVFILSVVMLNVIILNAVILNVVVPCSKLMFSFIFFSVLTKTKICNLLSRLGYVISAADSTPFMIWNWTGLKKSDASESPTVDRRSIPPNLVAKFREDKLKSKLFLSLF
jgi:hypothetical protein